MRTNSLSEKDSISWTDCHHEDRGDGVLILAPALMPKAPFVESLPQTLAEALHRHNRTHRAEERIRLRVALHAGEVSFDAYGVTAASINLTFRLLEAGELKSALGKSPAVLALITSGWFSTKLSGTVKTSTPLPTGRLACR